MKRKIIKIDEEKCNGCGACIPNCPEGALKVIDGKVRLLSDLFCDGLGACIKHCPQDAIRIEEREAEKYDERRVMENIVKQGENTIIEHLKHLKEHKQEEYFHQALDFLSEKNIAIDAEKIFEVMGAGGAKDAKPPSGCPGAKTMDFGAGKEGKEEAAAGKVASQLKQWPIQLHLVSPLASYYQGADVVLSADCVAYSLGNFHGDYLKGKSLAIACPKLDADQREYIEKMRALIDEARINTLTVLTMQVPCCAGLLNLAKSAASSATRKIPLKSIIVSLQGEVLSEEWVNL
ncbi:MAG: 4Fe-4S ferredoxin [Candidatus Omnitrophica bacterium CG11_big_fil_rev_8_21_14_0_20_42_13]|uniref:4Fe-4S ferredoxin n=1 Tax=Candidatus Ghiorseimicrobium undicola TaxID=1974746 RepID=A0A2H0LXM3_9BACT|nr:MAG: 4Fe-4S ferredoxin [Candidatus Omnitrophica bacterium CG11_big_fil_rev_8_21_14_0_20_42_13]